MTQSAAGSAPDLVLLHAFPLDASMWGAYPAAGRVFLPHQRGFGGTDLGTDEPSLDRVAEDVAALLDRLGSRRVILAGLSMGGYVVMACLRHPLVRERCAGIILADTRPAPDAPAAAERRLRMADRVLAEGTELLQDETVPSLLGETTWRERPRVVERVRAIVRSVPAPAVAWAQRAMAARLDSTQTLRDADLPALVVAGAEDVLTPPEECEAMAKLLADARFVLIPRAGHLTAMEEPALFTEAVTGFLRQAGS
ncbi:MAG: alpha/beta fold hydrolase [Frankiaceae bacterium]